MRRTLVLVPVLLFVAGSAAHARTAQQPAPVGGATFVVTGHGWGHGVGTLKIGSTEDFRVRDGTGVTHDVLAGAYTLTPDLKLKVDGESKQVVLPGPLLFQPGAAALALKH